MLLALAVIVVLVGVLVAVILLLSVLALSHGILHVDLGGRFLQLPFTDAGGMPTSSGAGRSPLDEAVLARQVQRGSRVLALSDYMIFSPT